jgi:hypothetical protein
MAQRVRLFGESSIQLFVIHPIWDVVRLHPEINRAQNDKTRLDGFQLDNYQLSQQNLALIV